MTHIKLFALKFIATLVILGIILGAGFDVAFGNVLWITIVLTAAAYIVGDLLILSKSSNMVATTADFILSFAVIYFMTDALTIGDGVFIATTISAISLTIFEYFFHQSVARSLDHEKAKNPSENQRTNSTTQLQVESSNELFPYEKDE
ncbi:YndM family protein [Jeotgalibacillus haloalkalitolerans]|uniref:YndM family protein n=1 Tax=Jeotgalibacillus haloalkalitolerans TaxID=3104292 RepID=A0ABU5KN76_9BACL|nr:YndM family protein [Jeotgalibacillus sp. HH7-29]MDZ5712592.1 YndM family protein [Jeotgalibacillus sp. HH7-29]